jgi:hypothetical protein
MEFNKLIKTQLFPILQKHGFEIIEEFKNIMRFASYIMKINVVFNECDNSHFVEMGKKNGMLYSLSDNTVKAIFDFELPIEQVTSEEFVKNIAFLFEQQEGIELLKGNIESLVKLVEQEGSYYASGLVQKQALEAALKAWENNDYEAFVGCIRKMDIEKIPQFYQLKYNIAVQKL